MKQLIKDIIFFQFSIILDIDYEKTEQIVKTAYNNFKKFDECDNIAYNRKLKKVVLFYSKYHYFLS